MTDARPGTNARPDTAVLYLCHFLDDAILAEYRKLKADLAGLAEVILLFDISEQPRPRPVPDDITLFRFDARTLRALDYPAKDCSLSAANVELFLMTFARQEPGYRHYWLVEYDVRFSGNWRSLFDCFAPSPSDLLATTIYRHGFNPAWDHWRSLRGPRRLERTQMLRAFLPIFRLSAEAVRILDSCYAQGWQGHAEALVPSLLELHNLTVEDIGGDGPFVQPANTNRFYRNTPGHWSHTPGTLTFHPILTRVGDEPDKLWHPVKPRPPLPAPLLLRDPKGWLKHRLRPTGRGVEM